LGSGKPVLAGYLYAVTARVFGNIEHVIDGLDELCWPLASRRGSSHPDNLGIATDHRKRDRDRRQAPTWDVRGHLALARSQPKRLDSVI
jgi:hypothetical protein